MGSGRSGQGPRSGRASGAWGEPICAANWGEPRILEAIAAPMSYYHDTNEQFSHRCRSRAKRGDRAGSMPALSPCLAP